MAGPMERPQVKAYIYVDLTRLPQPYSIGCYICKRMVGSDYHDSRIAEKALRQHMKIVHSTMLPLAQPNPFRDQSHLTRRAAQSKLLSCGDSSSKPTRTTLPS